MAGRFSAVFAGVALWVGLAGLADSAHENSKYDQKIRDIVSAMDCKTGDGSGKAVCVQDVPPLSYDLLGVFSMKAGDSRVLVVAEKQPAEEGMTADGEKVRKQCDAVSYMVIPQGG